MEKMPRTAPQETAEREKVTPENFNLDDIAAVETAKGSTYRYLADGTTQRFKKVEGKEYEPQRALVYVPDYEWVKTHASPEMLEKLGENELVYIQTLLQYAQGKGNRIYITDKNGKKLGSNNEIKSTEGPVYIACVTGDKVDFHIPVSHTPKIGYHTFDTRKDYDEKTGQWLRTRHVGNKVIKITLRDAE